LKQILKKSLLCWAICFLVASVIGILGFVKRRADFKFSLSSLILRKKLRIKTSEFSYCVDIDIVLILF
jgi:hypothetical protein